MYAHLIICYSVILKYLLCNLSKCHLYKFFIMPQQCKCATNTGSDDSKCLRVLKSLSKILIFKNVDIQKEKNSQSFKKPLLLYFTSLVFHSQSHYLLKTVQG